MVEQEQDQRSLEEEAAADMHIDEDPVMLAYATRTLPERLQVWADRAAKAKVALAVADQDVELAYSRAFLDARGQKRGDKTYTVEDAKASALCSPDYQSALVHRTGVESLYLFHKTVVDALVKKADMLREIGANQRADTRV